MGCAGRHYRRQVEGHDAIVLQRTHEGYARHDSTEPPSCDAQAQLVAAESPAGVHVGGDVGSEARNAVKFPGGVTPIDEGRSTLTDMATEPYPAVTQVPSERW